MGGLGCDNMTAILICFVNEEPYTSLARRCSKSSTKIETVGSQNKALHSWAHKRNCTMVHTTDTSEQVEESLTFGSSPNSKLNDTVSGANTDLDSELASSHDKRDNFVELYKEKEENNGIEAVEETLLKNGSLGESVSHCDTAKVGPVSDLWEDNGALSMDMEPCTAIETTV